MVVQKRHFTILVLHAPSLSLILLESTTQQKDLLTATTQPHSSSQASSLPSQHLSICHDQEILTNPETQIQ